MSEPCSSASSSASMSFGKQEILTSSWPSRPLPKRCQVPGCPNSKCRLTTHQNYDSRSYAKHRHRQEENSTASTVVRQWEPRVKKNTIQCDGVDGFPKLPVGDDQQFNPEFRSLFHHFFDSIFEPLAQIFRGPSISGMADYKSRMLSTALTYEGYCMGLIIQSQTHVDANQPTVEESQQSLSVYTEAVAAFRRQLGTIQTAPEPFHIELALLTLCTLISHDVSHHRSRSVSMHWTGLRQLVEHRGGLHCVTVSLAYVVHVDRMCAQYLNEKPSFPNSSLQSVPGPRPQFSKYGINLKHISSDSAPLLFSTVVEHCIDTCGLLESWETHHSKSISSATGGPIVSSEFTYYIRDRVDEQFTTLHADLWDEVGRNQCLLWATRIIEYPITWSNQIPRLNALICEHLVTTLCRQDFAMVWSDDISMLRWILFALVTVKARYRGRDWVISCIQAMLTVKYNSQDWPSDWWRLELENAQGWVWSDSYLEGRFHDACFEVKSRQISGHYEPDATLMSTFSLLFHHTRTQSQRSSDADKLCSLNIGSVKDGE